jgi:type VI secretion system secreted protein Hcp
MAFDAFLKLEGVKGEATAKGFEGAIELLSFSWGASNPVSVGAGGGMGAGKVSVSSFNFMKKSDQASPTLFQQCCSGKHFPKGTVTLRKAAGKQVDFLKYDITHVFVESIQWSGSGGGDDTPAESVSLAFQKVDITYTPLKQDGSPGSPVVASWDSKAVAGK